MIDMKKALQSIDDVIEKGPYKDTWASLSSWQTPKWYQKAKFGIFIHWGVYSVPAFDSEWYPRNMYIEGSKVYEHHIKTYGAHKDFGYKDFIPMFKAEKFDPNAWAALLKRRAQNTLYRWRSTMTVSRCTAQIFHIGTPMRWDRSAI